MNQYTVYVTPSAWREIKNLPGSIRQRVKRSIDDLVNNPAPPESKILTPADAESESEVEYEIYRIRLDKWRIIYLVTETEKVIDVLAVRKRPPYDYDDLEELLSDRE